MKQNAALFGLCCISLIVGFGVTPHHRGFISDRLIFIGVLSDVLIIALLNVIVFHFSGFSINPIRSRRFDDFFSFLCVSFVAHIVSMFFYMLLSNRGYGRYILLTSWMSLNILYWCWYRLSSAKRGRETVILVGEVSFADFEMIKNVYRNVLKVDGDISLLGLCEAVESVRLTSKCRYIVDFSGDLVNGYDSIKLLSGLNSVSLYSGCEFWEKVFGMVKIETDSAVWLYAAVRTRNSYRDVKRTFDVLVSLIGLVASVPICLMVFCLSRLFDPGPFLYRQKRLGLFGKEFTIYKIRTMRVDAENGGAVWAKVGDERVTKLGVLLRRSRIDEIPQFYNILRGDMSLIGPRPERRELAEKISLESKEFALRCFYKPGLTGWAQVNFRYGSSVQDSIRKLQYDLYYIKNWSLILDVNIVFRTVLAMIKGAR